MLNGRSTRDAVAAVDVALDERVDRSVGVAETVDELVEAAVDELVEDKVTVTLDDATTQKSIVFPLLSVTIEV